MPTFLMHSSTANNRKVLFLLYIDNHKYSNIDIIEFTHFYARPNTNQLHHGLNPTQSEWPRFIGSFRIPYKINKPLEW